MYFYMGNASSSNKLHKWLFRQKTQHTIHLAQRMWSSAVALMSAACPRTVFELYCTCFPLKPWPPYDRSVTGDMQYSVFLSWLWYYISISSSLGLPYHN